MKSSNISRKLNGRLLNSKSVQLCLVFMSYLFDDILCNEVENHLRKGGELLARGHYQDALTHFHAAIEGDPKNYLTYYKRATIFQALGKPKASLNDLNQVIALKVDFLEARMQRGQMLLKLGRLDEAHIDFEWILRLHPERSDVQQYYTLIEHFHNVLQEVQLHMAEHNWHEAVEIITRLMHDIPYDVVLREWRAQCYEHLGDRRSAIADVRAITRMKLDDTVGLLKLSHLYYEIAEVEEALQAVRECLKLDPDHKNCFAHYKKVKALFSHMKAMAEASNSQAWEKCVVKADAAYKIEQNMLDIVQQIKAKKCHCMNKQNLDPKLTINVCTEALNLDSNDVNVLCDRAEAYLSNDEFEAAKADFQQALNLNPNLQRANDGIQRAAKLLKLSKSRDYYKILGVKRNAQKKDIIRAYRKMAAHWHPDNYRDEEKKKAEKIFIDIADAKEVLTDPEKRAQFDNGEDPLDPEAQNHRMHRGNPHHGFPFSDMPFHFKFNF